ncbi:MAG: hypothetical protein MUF87_04710 [Anaerolineae bacterium]|nr:hypothetical protein [Anaerolineae bacterium]
MTRADPSPWVGYFSEVASVCELAVVVAVTKEKFNSATAATGLGGS